MTLNTWVERLAAERADAAVLTLNALLGVGTALAPVLVALFSGLGVWWALPLLVAIFAAGLFLSFAASKSALGPASAVVAAAGLPQRFWFYAAAVLLYGVVETLCGNWATLYLSTQRSVPPADASYALTAFWLMVTLGRVALAASARWLPAKWVYVALPLALAVVFQFVAQADGATSGMIAFGAAGLACSGILPLSISLGGAEFPTRAATISGELIAFYQIGYGVAAFGVAPLKELCDVDYSTAFSLGSLVSLLLGGVALAIVRRSEPSAWLNDATDPIDIPTCEAPMTATETASGSEVAPAATSSHPTWASARRGSANDRLTGLSSASVPRDSGALATQRVCATAITMCP